MLAYHTEEERLYGTDEAGRTLAEILFSEVRPGVYSISHTEVDDSLRGQGVAGELVKRAVEEIEGRGAKVEATCEYAAAWLKRHKK